MAGCCASRSDYARFFGAGMAARSARRLRRRGLRGSALALVRLAGDVRGASVLDVGGGVGGIGLALIDAGASSVTNVDLSPEFEPAAAELIAERNVADRVERRVGDFVEEAASIEPHDVVVMHRVVCCYPDVDALVGAAAEHARRSLVLTYPQRRALIRLGVTVQNAFFRLSGSSFRIHVHPVGRIDAAAARAGLTVAARERNGRIWESAAFVR